MGLARRHVIRENSVYTAHRIERICACIYLPDLGAFVTLPAADLQVALTSSVHSLTWGSCADGHCEQGSLLARRGFIGSLFYCRSDTSADHATAVWVKRSPHPLDVSRASIVRPLRDRKLSRIESGVKSRYKARQSATAKRIGASYASTAIIYRRVKTIIRLLQFVDLIH